MLRTSRIQNERDREREREREGGGGGKKSRKTSFLFNPSYDLQSRSRSLKMPEMNKAVFSEGFQTIRAKIVTSLK